VTPLGFNREGAKLVENPEEMDVVRRIHTLRAGGVSLQGIATVLNKAGVATKRGGKWYAVTIQSVLRIHSAR